jgi:hypothetical protein
MPSIPLILAAATLLATAALPTRAAESYDNCVGFIDSLPATIGTQGIWCLRKDLGTAMTIGSAITIAANNVTIDCNDFKLGGLAAGTGTFTQGIHAVDRLNASVRHCSIRGFQRGLLFEGSSGGGHVIEDNRFDGNTYVGLQVEGDGSVVRRNQVRDTGGSTSFTAFAYGIYTGLTVDVIDNTVSGVLPIADSGGDGQAIGIYTDHNSNGSISDNRIRGLVKHGTGLAGGIISNFSGRISLRGNDLSDDNSSAGSVGIACDSSNGRAIGNIINGFAIPLVNCRDDGNSL